MESVASISSSAAGLQGYTILDGIDLPHHDRVIRGSISYAGAVHVAEEEGLLEGVG